MSWIKVKKGAYGIQACLRKGLDPPPSSKENLGAGHLVILSHCHSQEMGLLKKKQKQTNKHITELIQDSQCPYSHIEDPKPRITVSAVSPPQFYQGIVDKNYMYVRYATGFNICCDDYHSQVTTPITSQSYSCFCCEHRRVT